MGWNNVVIIFPNIYNRLAGLKPMDRARFREPGMARRPVITEPKSAQHEVRKVAVCGHAKESSYPRGEAPPTCSANLRIGWNSSHLAAGGLESAVN